MTRRAEDLLAEALRLADADRGELAAQLLASLDAESDAGTVAGGDEVIRSRLDDIRSGRVTPIPWDEARRQIAADTDDAAG